MSKFRAGDRVRVHNHPYGGFGNSTCGTVIKNNPSHRGDYQVIPDEYEDRHPRGLGFEENELTLVERTMDNLQVGDVIDTGDDDTKKVLAVLGEVVCLSYDYDHDEVDDWYTAKEIVNRGWKLKDTSEPKEMTVTEISEELGYDVKVVKERS